MSRILECLKYNQNRLNVVTEQQPVGYINEKLPTRFSMSLMSRNQLLYQYQYVLKAVAPLERNI